MTPPPARQIRLLANLAPFAAVVFALLAVWLVVTTVRGLEEIIVSVVDGADGPVFAAVLLVALGAAASLVTALIAYRLGVQVPRTLRGWEAALDERSRALRDD